MDLRELQDAYRQQQREVTDERIAVGALIRTVLSEADVRRMREDGRWKKDDGRWMMELGKGLKKNKSCEENDIIGEKNVIFAKPFM